MELFIALLFITLALIVIAVWSLFIALISRTVSIILPASVKGKHKNR